MVMMNRNMVTAVMEARTGSKSYITSLRRRVDKEEVSIISVAQRLVGWIVAFASSSVLPSQSLGFACMPKAKIQWLDSCRRLGIH